ncbi:hypothetical protein PC128_g6727 [Phytophthora cactorum]|nr:hypothetical protein PC120_g12955 [Phytophthora cactorum]KAG3197557.1 hypothetical protein PC128_g6727 [Phytophthora cactorum]KAG4045203.1 hypothetical protein PC123_g19384 [Phytophthora cactorum]
MTGLPNLEDLLALFRDTYTENRDGIDAMLLTAIQWDVDSNTPELPFPGDIVDITG